MSGLIKPKQFQMQSGPGKYCDEKYSAMRLQDGQTSSRKFIPTLQLPHFLSKMQKRLAPEVIDRLIEESQGLGERTSKSVDKTKGSQSWVFNAQSRAEYYQATQNKDRVPGTGYYLPKYSSIYPNPPVPEIKPSPLVKPKLANGSRPSEAGNIPDYPRPKNASIAFHHQLSRPDITTMVQSVSDKRFELLLEPPIFSKVKKVATPNFAKTLRRKTLLKSQESPRYDPKFDAVWRKDVPKIEFRKVSGRSPGKTPPSTHLFYDNIRFTQTNSRSTGTCFGSLSSRPLTGVLPTHMKSVNNRMSITVMQESSLVMSGVPGLSMDLGRRSSTVEKGIET